MVKPTIIFEDDNLLVLNKPAGLSVHEGSGVKEKTLVDYLYSKLGKGATALERGGLIHRLDKDTSGVILVAKTPEWFTYLKDIFKRHQVTKKYTTLLHGTLSPESGRVDIPLSRDLVNRTKFSPNRNGREAVTNYKVVKHIKNYTLVDASPVTGRTHQIRVHFASIGHPVVGDQLYGRKTDTLKRQFLHATQISFSDPNGKKLSFQAPLSEDLSEFLDAIR